MEAIPMCLGTTKIG